MIMVAGASVLALIMRKKDKGEAGANNDTAAAKTGNADSPREVADDERRKIMSEMGKIGAQKSAAVRRAKKVAREAIKDVGSVPA